MRVGGLDLRRLMLNGNGLRHPLHSGSSVVGRQAGAESFPRLPIPNIIGIELCLVGGRDRTLRQSLKSLLAPAVPPVGGFLSAA